jgi:predicted PurR-regulated permease PerM
MLIFSNRMERETTLRILFFISILVLCVVMIFNIPGMLWHAIISIVAAYLLLPLINKMEALGISRSLSILIVYAILGGFLFLIYQTSYTNIVQQFEGLSREFPNIVHKISVKIESMSDEYSGLYSVFKDFEIDKKLSIFGTNLAERVLNSVPSLVTAFVSFLVLVPFYTFFLLKDAVVIKKWLLGMLPNRYLESGVALIYNINKQTSGFIQAKLLEAGVLGIMVYVGLLILGIKYALLLSLFAAVMNLVPYIGIFIGAAPGLAIAYFYGEGTAAVWYTVLIYTIAQLADIFLVIPLVLAKRISIHPMIVVIMLILGFELMGVLGMILAVPFFSIIKAIFIAVSARINVSQ